MTPLKERLVQLEVLRYDPDENQIVLHDIFNYRNGASLRATGYLPSFIDALVEKELLDLEFLYGRDGDGSLATAGTVSSTRRTANP